MALFPHIGDLLTYDWVVGTSKYEGLRIWCEFPQINIEKLTNRYAIMRICLDEIYEAWGCDFLDFDGWIEELYTFAVDAR